MEEGAQRDVEGRRSFDALHEFAVRFAGDASHSTARIDAAAAQTLSRLEAAGVDALLLKGRALADLLYASSGQRGYSDVDLLVAPDSLQAAEGVLRGLGYANTSATQGIDDVGGVVHAQTWVRSGAGTIDDPTIDLHHRFPGARAEPRIAWEALAAHRISIEVGGRPAPVLDRTGQAVQLAVHAAQHGPGFVKHTDELALALATWPEQEWVSAAALAEAIGALDAFAAGLRLLPEGVQLASRLSLPSNAALDWEIRNRASRPRGTFHVKALTEAATTRERLDVARRSLFPTRMWIRHQYSWAARGPISLAIAYSAHLVRAPFWAARAWLFSRRARRG